jgi:feruloyl esterase
VTTLFQSDALPDLSQYGQRFRLRLRQKIGVDSRLPPTPLIEESGWRSNPGALRMFTYVPPGRAAGAPLVVVLHGCTQTAASYDHGAGWSTLAERYGFALLLPEQQRSNNPNGCFSWFQSDDIQRDRGEAASIHEMVEKMVRDKGIDRDRVFITGLSAGGAMTSVMLACYPDVFAGGAIIAGLPYGAADSVQEALQSMLHSPTRSAEEWGALVRRASKHTGPWPRVSVWHGTADKTVVPSNAREVLKQWTNVHGLPLQPSEQALVDGHRRQIWRDETGNERIEFYAIAQMAHGTPLATGGSDDECGTAGPFLLDVGISSSYHIARFFGLADALNDRGPALVPIDAQPATGANASAHRRARPASALGTPLPILEGEILEPEADVSRSSGRMPPRPSVDIGSVITSALKAAGLMK